MKVRENIKVTRLWREEEQMFEGKSVWFVFKRHLKRLAGGFPADSVVKNLPANVGDMGSITGLGRSYLLWSS